MGPYPISYNSYPEDETIADVNVDNAFGGPDNLPDTGCGPDTDRSYGGARTWNPDYTPPSSYA